VETDGGTTQVTLASASAPSKARLEAATRYGAAWEAVRSRASGSALSDGDLIEMHGAALALIWATGTMHLEEALAILHKLDQGPGWDRSDTDH
jgi:hypothetical protein